MSACLRQTTSIWPPWSHGCALYPAILKHVSRSHKIHLHKILKISWWQSPKGFFLYVMHITKRCTSVLIMYAERERNNKLELCRVMNCLPKYQAAISFVFFFSRWLCMWACANVCVAVTVYKQRWSCLMTEHQPTWPRLMSGLCLRSLGLQTWRKLVKVGEISLEILFSNHFYFEEFFFYWLFAGL